VERDLDDVIQRSLDERVDSLGSARPSSHAVAATVAGVRRRRRRRAAGEVFASVAVVAALVTGLSVGHHDDAPAPAITSSPTTTARPTTAPSPTPGPVSPSATPAPTPTATEAAATGPTQAQINAGLGLPVTAKAPTDVWEDAGAGWVLGIYRPVWAGDDAASSGPVRSTLVLADPTGTVYRLRELPLGKEVQLLHWEPGTSKALVTIAPIHDGVTRQAERGWLDVRTGRLTVAPGATGKVVDDALPEPSFVGFDHRGDEVWFVTSGETGGGGAATLVVQRPDGTLVRRAALDGAWVQLGSSLLDPSGRHLVLPGTKDPDSEYEVVDLDTGRQTTHRYGVTDRYCAVVGWTSASRVLARCTWEPWSATGYGGHLLSPGDTLVELSVDGAAPHSVTSLAVGDPAVPLWQGLSTGSGRIVVGAAPVGTDDGGRCVAGLYLLDGARSTPLGIDHVVTARPVGETGSTIYAITDASCHAGEGRTARLEALAGKKRTMLLPAPATTEEHLEGGLASWAVAGGPAGIA